MSVIQVPILSARLHITSNRPVSQSPRIVSSLGRNHAILPPTKDLLAQQHFLRSHMWSLPRYLVGHMKSLIITPGSRSSTLYIQTMPPPN